MDDQEVQVPVSQLWTAYGMMSQVLEELTIIWSDARFEGRKKSFRVPHVGAVKLGFEDLIP